MRYGSNGGTLTAPAIADANGVPIGAALNRVATALAARVVGMDRESFLHREAACNLKRIFDLPSISWRPMNERYELLVASGNTESLHLPALLEHARPGARFAFEEFFYGRIRNPFTRRAYLHAVRQLSEWCVQRGLELARVTPADVGRHLDSLPVALPTRKLHLAALRRFFDELVLRHVVLLNPALSVRTERYQMVEGKTPEISIEHARRLLKSIDVAHVVGLRDRAVIAILIYTAARVGRWMAFHMP